MDGQLTGMGLDNLRGERFGRILEVTALLHPPEVRGAVAWGGEQHRAFMRRSPAEHRRVGVRWQSGVRIEPIVIKVKFRG